MRKIALLSAAAVLSATTLTGCFSDAEIASAHAIITALPTEVDGCTFLGNVDAAPRASIENARFEIQLKTAKLGGTHLVETLAYAGQISFKVLGVGLSGRAYKCPVGKGPLLPSKDANLTFELPSADYLLDSPFSDD